MPQNIKQFIDNQMNSWAGKTISSNEHFQSELRETLSAVALETLRMVGEKSENNYCDAGDVVTGFVVPISDLHSLLSSLASEVTKK